MTLDELIFERAGLIQGALVARALQDWIGAAAALDSMPTTAGFAELMGLSERQGWRSRARIRRYFTDAEFRSVVLQAAEQADQEFRSITISLPAVREPSVRRVTA